MNSSGADELRADNNAKYGYQIAFASLAFVVLIYALLHRQKGKSGGKRLPPGPRGWPIFGNIGLLLGKLPHHVFRELAKVYGPILYLRLGSVSCVVVSSPELVAASLQNQDHVFDRRPASAAARIMGRDKSITFAHGDYWRYTRNIATKELLTKARVKSYQGVRRAGMVEVLRSLMEAAKTGQTLVMRDRTFPFVTSTFSQTMLRPKTFFGKGQETLIHFTEKQLQERILESVILFGAFNLGDYIPLLKRFDVQGYEKRMRKISEQIDEVMDVIMEEKEKATAAAALSGQNDDSPRDFMDLLLALPGRDGQQHLHQDIIKILPMEMLVAANDSTNATIEWSLCRLITHPEVIAKLQHEIDTVVGQERLVEESDLPDLKYLQACVKEVLRLHPPSPLLLPHESSAPCVVAGYHIPARTQLFINVHAIGRHPDWWESPESFRPERFLEGHPNATPIDIMQGTLNPHFEFIPFGWGRRSCPGFNLGYVTVQQTLARLFQCFDISLPPGVSEVDFGEIYGIAVVKEIPLEVVLTQRVPSSLIDT